MNKLPKNRILFVYNADSGLSNALFDYGKKYIAPSKYDCQLCMISYGPFGMKKDWKSFVGSLPYRVEFLHRDEFIKDFPKSRTTMPVMIVIDNSTARTLINSTDFANIHNLKELKSKVTGALADHNPTA